MVNLKKLEQEILELEKQLEEKKKILTTPVKIWVKFYGKCFDLLRTYSIQANPDLEHTKRLEKTLLGLQNIINEAEDELQEYYNDFSKDRPVDIVEFK